MRRHIACLALCLLVLAAYSNAFTGGFVLDSKVLLLEDPRIREATTSNLNLIFERSYWWPYTDSNLYRPLTTLSFLFNYATLGGGTSPVGYHVVNLLLHAVNVLLAYGLILRMSGRFWPSLFVAAIWAVHPLSTEAVTNLTGRADLLAASGVLGALFAYDRTYADSVAGGFLQAAPRAGPPGKAGRRLESGSASTGPRGGSVRWIVIAIVLATLGMFAKESGVAVIGVIVLYDAIFRRPAAAVWKWLALLLPLCLLLYQRAQVVTAGVGPEPFVDNPLAGADFWTARLTALSIAGRYLWLTIWPRRLSSDYSYAQIPMANGSLADVAAWFAVAAVAAIAVVLVVRLGRNTPTARLAGFALAFAFMTFLPASNILFTSGTIMAERLMYLPSLGLIAAVVIALCSAAARAGRAEIAAIAVVVIVAACGVRTFARNRDWRDDVSLWTSAARSAPGSFKAHQGLADALYEADPNHRDLDAILAAADRSVAILDPLPDAQSVPAVFRRAAGYYLEQGDRLRTAAATTQSAAAYERSVALTTRYLAMVRGTSSSANRGTTRDVDPAKQEELSESFVMLATGYSRLQNHEKAIEAAEQAHSAAPLNPTPYRVLAGALIDGGKLDQAAIWLLTGVTVTGDSELRQATIDLYRGGGDPAGCAVRDEGRGPVLNPACETVRRHLCAATKQAIQIHRDGGHRELAEQLERGPLQSYGCK